MIVAVPASARRRQARKVRPGGRVPCGGRAAHRAIVAMCDTADSLTWRVLERLFMRWATFIWSAQRMVAQRSARVLRRLRQVVLICGTVARQFVGRSRTTATAAVEEIVGARVRHKVRRA